MTVLADIKTKPEIARANVTLVFETSFADQSDRASKRNSKGIPTNFGMHIKNAQNSANLWFTRALFGFAIG